MRIEELNLIVSLVTLVAIGITAAAAVIQLRHLRGTYQLSAVMHLVDRFGRPDMVAAIEFVRYGLSERLEDPAYRASLLENTSKVTHPELGVCDFQEQVGSYVRHGLISESLYFDCASYTAPVLWNHLEPVVAVLRRKYGPSLYENFEYLVVRTRMYTARTTSVFDRRTRPITVHDPWAGEDAAREQAAASNQSG